MPGEDRIKRLMKLGNDPHGVQCAIHDDQHCLKALCNKIPVILWYFPLKNTIFLSFNSTPNLFQPKVGVFLVIIHPLKPTANPTAQNLVSNCQIYGNSLIPCCDPSHKTNCQIFLVSFHTKLRHSDHIFT